MSFIGVAAKDSESAMQSFIERTGVGIFPHINDVESQIWVRYGIGYQPAFAFIDKSGNVSTFAALSGAAVQEKINTLF